MTVITKPGPVKPIAKPKAPNPSAPVAKPSVVTSKQAAQIVKQHTAPKIKPEDDPSHGVDPEVVEEEMHAAPQKYMGKQGKATTIIQNPDKTTETTTEDVGEATIMKSPHATVGVSVGMTKSLGNYENVKATVSLFLPCELDETAIEETYAMAKEWVDAKVTAISEEIDSQMSGE